MAIAPIIILAVVFVLIATRQIGSFKLQICLINSFSTPPRATGYSPDFGRTLANTVSWMSRYIFINNYFI